MAADRALRVPPRKNMSSGKGARKKMAKMVFETLGLTKKEGGTTETRGRVQTTTQTTREILMVLLTWYHSGHAVTKYLKHKIHSLLSDTEYS